MMSEWMENRNINESVKQNPDADRSGLAGFPPLSLRYFHRLDIFSSLQTRWGLGIYPQLGDDSRRFQKCTFFYDGWKATFPSH